MSAESRIAHRYAKSVVSLAKNQGELATIKNDADFLKETFEASRELRLLLKNPIIQTSKKLPVLRAIFKDKLGTLMLHFIDIVCKKGRENFLPSIIQEIIREYNVIEGIQEATLVTASELDNKELEKFEELVKKHTELSKVTLEVKVNPSLIGGFILNIGDRQIDESVQSKLNNLAVQFAK